MAPQPFDPRIDRLLQEIADDSAEGKALVGKLGKLPSVGIAFDESVPYASYDNDRILINPSWNDDTVKGLLTSGLDSLEVPPSKDQPQSKVVIRHTYSLMDGIGDVLPPAPAKSDGGKPIAGPDLVTTHASALLQKVRQSEPKMPAVTITADKSPMPKKT